mgnify:CR=1 FL=1
MFLDFLAQELNPVPDGFEGNPLLKSYELLTREVKPWPGEVDVEPMPESDISSESEKEK